MIRKLVVPAFAALTVVLATRPDPMPLRADESRAALASLGQEYGDLQLWVRAIAAATDTLPPQSSERAQALAQQLARLIRPLEAVFEEATASLSTAQLELILPLWERMAFAHAGFALLEEEAAALGGDPSLQPAELHDLVAQLSAVLDFAAEIQAMILSELTTPVATPLRIT
jgi:hypothetical protein